MSVIQPVKKQPMLILRNAGVYMSMRVFLLHA